MIQNANDLSDLLDDLTGAHGLLKSLFYYTNSDFKDMVSMMLNKKHEFVVSLAYCNYYYSKLITTDTQTFQPGFLKWTEKLDTAIDYYTYFEFFETYGTHFPVETTFGARIAYVDEINIGSRSDSREENLEAISSAFYTMLFRSRVRLPISTGNNNLTVATQIHTVGSPPPETGDVQTWVSAVQLNPSPSKFRLEPIEHLFSGNYMKGSKADFSQIYDRIIKFKPYYFSYLTLKDFCRNDRPQSLKIKGLQIFSKLNFLLNVSLNDCIKACLEKMNCDMIAHHRGIEHTSQGKCLLHKKGQNNPEFPKQVSQPTWDTHLILDRSARANDFDKVKPLNHKPMKSYDGKIENIHDCRQRCDADFNCFGSLFRTKDDVNTCQLYDHKILTAEFVYHKHANISLSIQNRCFDLALQ